MKITDTTSALVTGGGSGLGEATVRRLHELGAAVVIADLESSRGAALADELGERARFVATDVRDEAAMGAAVAAAKELGELRVVVTCAGVATPGRILSRRGRLPLETYRTVLEINTVGSFNALAQGAEAMVDNEPVDGDRGVVVMTASIAAFDGQVGQAAYASSKGAIAALTLTAARDLADKQIRVVTIAPGTMETPMMAGLPAETKESLAALVPHPARLGRPEEYAQLVEAVVAHPLLNGEVIRMDGALRMPPR